MIVHRNQFPRHISRTFLRNQNSNFKFRGITDHILQYATHQT
jgi:hypothetical protein